MNQRNKNKEKHGYWEEYWYNRNLRFKGNFINGNKDGYWEGYWPNGKLSWKGNYINDKEIGFWHYNYETEFHL